MRGMGINPGRLASRSVARRSDAGRRALPAPTVKRTSRTSR